MTLVAVPLVIFAVVAVVCLVVLFRRQRLNKGMDEWSAGAERLPLLSQRADTEPHIGGSGGGGGIGGGIGGGPC